MKGKKFQRDRHSKIQKSLCELGKTCRFSLRPAIKIATLNRYINWEKLCLNLKFRVENKIGELDIITGALHKFYLMHEIFLYLKF